jgi:hypothetical protein
MRRLLGVLAGVLLVLIGFPGCEPGPARLVGAGDIASCGLTGDTATAEVVAGITGTVVTFGDNVYPDGTSGQFADCYGPTWGRYNSRVRPAPGNHEYRTAGASGYFGYFGDRAGPSGGGYYFYDLGSWRVFSLNSEANIAASADFVRRNAGGKRCIAAYWHKPLVSSGVHGNNPSVLPLWQAVFDVGGDLVLNGHDHAYERFAELGRNGAPSVGGTREIVVGTGGANLYAHTSVKPGSQVRSAEAYGVISVDLNSAGYSWRFHPVSGETFTDSGSGGCD